MAKILCENCNDPRFDADRECEYCVEGYIETSPGYTFDANGVHEWFCPMCDEAIEHQSNPCKWCQAKIDWPESVPVIEVAP